MKTKTSLLTVILLTVMLVEVQSQTTLEIRKQNDVYAVSIKSPKGDSLYSPTVGLWSIATAWKDSWPKEWVHAVPDKLEKSGEWTILSGRMPMKEGYWLLRDSYREEKGMIKCIRRFEWKGDRQLDSISLSVRWNINKAKMQAFLPGILYYGNPSGEKNRPEWNPHYHGIPGEMAFFEEHRFPMPFAVLEYQDKKGIAAAFHSLPSRLKDKTLPDHWWSMGVIAKDEYSELSLLSGPVTYNDQESVVKGLQWKSFPYDNTFICIEPGQIIEKTFYLDVYQIESPGTGFQKALHQSLNIFKPYYYDDLPEFRSIISEKLRYAQSRWLEGEDYAGFNMYDKGIDPKIVMGWCGQAAACGFAFQELTREFRINKANEMIQKSLDFLAESPFSEDGFNLIYDIKKKEWSASDPVSMGQAMYNYARAIESAAENKSLDTKKWRDFLKNASDYAANRILDPDWNPRSTAEAFFVGPLARAAKLFENHTYRMAAIKGAKYYAQRHVSMKEPYWGGTLDANGEDKEGAWAAFQAFLEVYELTKKPEYLEWARHACDVCLSYTVVWDIPLPPGRLADHGFKSRGWTVVSPQNQHLDVYGVLYAPEIYRLAEYLMDEDLKKLAKVMFLSCGQLIDPFGSQGEQIQHTNFSQHGDLQDVYHFRGGYAETWTVFWITAHFLNAGAKFMEMKADL